TGAAGVTLAFRDAAAAAPWLSDLRPVTLSPARAATPATLTDALAAARAAALARAPMAQDLPLRLGHAESRRQALAALSVVLAETGGDADALGAAALAIVLDRPRLLARPGLFETGALATIADDFSLFIKHFIENPARDLARIPLGRATALARGGDPFRTDTGIAGAIAETARRTPAAPALEAGPVRLDFAGLEARAAALAGALAARGAGPGTVIGLCLERSADLVIAMLAILRT